MYGLDDLEAIAANEGSAGLDALLLPVESGVAALPRISLNAEQSTALRQGKRISIVEPVAQLCCCAVDTEGRLVALVEIDAQGALKVLRGFNSTR